MKLRIALLLTLAALAAGVVVAERRRARAPGSAQSLLYLVPDAERDLARLPSHFTRLSDKEEIAAGNALASRELAGRGKLSADGEAIEAYLDRLRARPPPPPHPPAGAPAPAVSLSLRSGARVSQCLRAAGRTRLRRRRPLGAD